MRALVFVTLKPSVFDPQGTTVAEALHTLGYASVKDVRQGKYFELDIEASSPDEARRLASDAAAKLLSNPVIESYRVEVEGNGASGRSAGASASGRSAGASASGRSAGASASGRSAGASAPAGSSR